MELIETVLQLLGREQLFARFGVRAGSAHGHPHVAEPIDPGHQLTETAVPAFPPLQLCDLAVQVGDHRVGLLRLPPPKAPP